MEWCGWMGMVDGYGMSGGGGCEWMNRCGWSGWVLRGVDGLVWG